MAVGAVVNGVMSIDAASKNIPAAVMNAHMASSSGSRADAASCNVKSRLADEWISRWTSSATNRHVSNDRSGVMNHSARSAGATTRNALSGVWSRHHSQIAGSTRRYSAGSRD